MTAEKKIAALGVLDGIRPRASFEKALALDGAKIDFVPVEVELAGVGPIRARAVGAIATAIRETDRIIAGNSIRAKYSYLLHTPT